MNVIFGSATTLSENRHFELLHKETERIYAKSARLTSADGSSIQAGYISDDGAVLGCASDNNLCLLYLGALHKPLADWECGSPLDNANVTAQYLLSRYRDCGLKFLDNVFGHYVAIVCDPDQGKLILGCDPRGVSTLYYAELDQTLVFSDNLFTIANALKNEIARDRTLENFFLVYGFMPWNRLLFKQIKPFSGAVLEWHKGQKRIEEIETKYPWQNRFRDIDCETATEEDVIELLYDALMLATEEQVASSDAVAVLLGGFDSALIASALHRLGKQVETFSFYYDNPLYDQAHTDTLSSYLKIRHNWIPITEETIRDGLLAYSLIFNRPTNWPNYLIQTEYVCSEIRKREILHCYTGDGCDHVFLGYPRTHVMSKFFNSQITLPNMLLRLAIAVARWEAFEYGLGRPYRVSLSILRNLARKRHVRGHIYFTIFDELSLGRLRAEPPPDQEMGIEAILENLAEGLEGLTPDRLTYHGKASASANKAKMLGSSNSSGITILSPYLHPAMAHIAKQLPDRLLRPERKTESAVTGKYILMEMAEKKKLLPREVIYQKKIAAVDAPIDDWYFGPLRETMLKIMEELPFKCSRGYVENLLKPKLAEKLYKRFVSSDHITTHELSLLATYASFTKKL